MSYWAKHVTTDHMVALLVQLPDGSHALKLQHVGTERQTKKLDVEILENRVTICRSVRPVECIVHGPDFTPVKTK